MFETQRTLFNKRACGLLIAGAFVLLVIVFGVSVPSPSPVLPVKERTSPPPRREDRTPPVFETEAFYRTIIDNNLFRPLGWTPPRPIEPYRLIGTILPIDAKTPPIRYDKYARRYLGFVYFAAILITAKKM